MHRLCISALFSNTSSGEEQFSLGKLLYIILQKPRTSIHAINNFDVIVVTWTGFNPTLSNYLIYTAYKNDYHS